ncbi:hypothetical protein GCM10007884_03850 [Methylobacterium brachythecii]|uniref:(2Fe-2S) ferredoxin domain-containing protein n=1 Tax=Methylobacterium brachythecii TaxID=1176177 RepID=A0ABQ6D170_9HYPH|nr:hypothetical protein GCM10007884_03850 [Methylobacterium brachythecii]
MGKKAVQGAMPATRTTMRAAKADFEGIVVVCAKCAKRQGFAKRDFCRSLKQAFRRETRGRKIKVVETGCFGPCPKRLIAVATPASMSCRRVMLLDPALTAPEIRGLLPDLGLDAAARSPETTGGGRDS